MANSNAQVLRFAEWSERTVCSNAEFEQNPDAIQQWSVTFDILLNNWIIGTDEGVLWVDDQFLYVAGKHTSFAIPGHRLKPLTYKSEFWKPLERRYTIPIVGQPRLNQSIQFDIENRPPFIPEIFGIRSAIERCAATGTGEVEGQLPPLNPFVNAHSDVKLWKILSRSLTGWMVATGLILCGILLLAEEMRLNGPGWVLFGFFIVQVIAHLYPRMKLVSRALRGRKQFEMLRKRSVGAQV